MRTTLALLAALPLAVLAQTTYHVEVGGSTLGPTLPYYAPNVLNILVGDIVIWNNVSGTHNVNGTTVFFPANPQGFSSGGSSSQQWTFTHTFTIAGAYDYMCTTEGHSATQMGRIIVTDATNIAESTTEEPMKLAPTPATDNLFVEVGSRSIAHFEVMGLDGRMMARHTSNTGRLARIPVTNLPQGNYILRITETTGRTTALRFSKN